MEFKTLLVEEIRSALEDLSKEKKGSQEYKEKAAILAQLIDRAIELEKIESENENCKLENRANRRVELVKEIVAGAGIVLPIAVTIWGTFKSFEFEKEGTISTIMGRGFINKLLPKK